MGEENFSISHFLTYFQKVREEGIVLLPEMKNRELAQKNARESEDRRIRAWGKKGGRGHSKKNSERARRDLCNNGALVR